MRRKSRGKIEKSLFIWKSPTKRGEGLKLNGHVKVNILVSLSFRSLTRSSLSDLLTAVMSTSLKVTC